jgi:hypothetical protein
MRKHPFTQAMFIAVCIMFIISLLPSTALSSGSIKLNKGAMLNMSSADLSGKGGGCQLPKLNCGGASAVDQASKTIRAKTIASLSGKGSHWAKVGSRFSVSKGDNGQTYGNARITISGISYHGTVGALGIAAGKGILRMSVSGGPQKDIMVAAGGGAAAKSFQNSNVSSYVEMEVKSGEAYDVNLEIVAAAGSGSLISPAEVNFYDDGKMAKYQNIRVDILSSGTPIAIGNPGNGQVFFYDNPQCQTNNPNDWLSFNVGAKISDLTKWTLLGTNQKWNDRISCMKIGPGVNRVIVYQHINYKGKSKTFTRTNSNPAHAYSLSGDWWDNSISSFKIE